MWAYFGISFAICFVLAAVATLLWQRRTREPGHMHWLAALMFALLVAGTLTLLNVGR